VTTFVADPCVRGLNGRVRVPGDKSVSHRALLLAARAVGRSRLSGLSSGADVLCTLRAIGQFGAGISRHSDGSLIVEGGPQRLREPESLVDVGNSGTAIRLLAGWATGVDGLAVLAGDESIARRPMGRVTEPLRLMGARVDGRQGGRLPPLVVRGGGLTGIDYRLPVPSAQVKGALLLAGLTADGETTVREDVPTRIHTEEMLARSGAEVRITPGAVTVRRSALQPLDLEVPGDPSQAAFWIVAACVTPASDLTVEHIYVGPGRAGFLDVLTRMGADLQVLDKDGSSSTATIRARYGPLAATFVGGEEVPALIDEIPALAVAAAYAAGSTTFTDAAELRVKESDRIATMVTALRAVGASAEERRDGLVVQGSDGRPLRGGLIDSAGDHRVAMAMSVAALAASAPVTVSGWEAVATSYPGFEKDYNLCRS
jgi:3-phosphoshikimate 1-carboxyvinyltransferase